MKKKQPSDKAVVQRMIFLAAGLIKMDNKLQWAHTLQLLRLANEGVVGARALAHLSLERYFARIDEEQMS